MLRRSFRILFTVIAAMFFVTVFSGNKAMAQSFVLNAPRVVGQNEQFTIAFSSNGDVDNFNAPSISGASVLAGPSKSSYSSMQIINGRRTDSHEVTYTYVLQAGSSGTVRISAASANVSGRSMSTRPVSISIVAGASSQSGQQSSGYSGGNSGSRQQADNDYGYSTPVSSGKADVFMRLDLNKTKVVKGEPIIATLKIYTRSNITGFEDIKFPVFNGFWSQEIETPQNINFTRERVGNQIYSSAVLRKYMLLPQQTGKLTINPAELVCQVQVVSSQRRSRNLFDDFFDSDAYSLVKKKVATGRATVYVSPLPGNAPASFGGGVGNFSMSARLTRQDIKSNEAASLIIDINGTGNLNLISAPAVTLPSDFEKYDVKTTNSFTNGASGASGKKTFEFPFIPRSEGKFTIPQIDYSYYDISQGRYVTLHAGPITVNVTKGTASNSSYVTAANQQQVSNIGEDIRYIANGSPRLAKKGSFLIVSWLFYFIFVLILAAFYGLYRYLKNLVAINGDILRSKNKRANKVAKSRLKLAQTYLGQNKVQEFYEELHKALLGYISDKLSIQFADMQRDTIESTLEEKKIGKDEITGFMKLLDDCEMVRYSPEGAAGAMDAQYENGVKIISDLENKLK
ncbi:MAG TPA: BatD family protein [Candidatus Egerieousia sp.]|nr:BatD family protein [Candidatus Egerieousia sp.]